MIALSDTEGRSWVLAGDDEAEMLRQLVAAVQEADPDVIEGHNLFGFDLPYLAARAEALRVPLALGRDGSEMRFGRERNCPIGGIVARLLPGTRLGPALHRHAARRAAVRRRPRRDGELTD